ncbi:hypothetical protein MMC10_007301 [Thelotrema lepadinum]|nr:hypothetical protein [Thelotrema lepadinum]
MSNKTSEPPSRSIRFGPVKHIDPIGMYDPFLPLWKHEWRKDIKKILATFDIRCNTINFQRYGHKDGWINNPLCLFIGCAEGELLRAAEAEEKLTAELLKTLRDADGGEEPLWHKFHAKKLDHDLKHAVMTKVIKIQGDYPPVTDEED